MHEQQRVWTEGEQLRVKDCEQEVMRKIAERKRLGLAKYGVSVADSPQTRMEFLQHAQDEAMDLAIYLERLMQEETC